jgi:hypothetical protein
VNILFYVLDDIKEVNLQQSKKTGFVFVTKSGDGQGNFPVVRGSALKINHIGNFNFNLERSIE